MTNSPLPLVPTVGSLVANYGEAHVLGCVAQLIHEKSKKAKDRKSARFWALRRAVLNKLVDLWEATGQDPEKILADMGHQ